MKRANNQSRRTQLRIESLEDRLAPTVNLAVAPPVPFAEGDSGSANMLFMVTRSGDTTPPFTVNYATQNGTALAGTDYTATSGTLSFAAGQTTADIAVPIIGNTLLQSDRTFTVALTNPTESAAFAPQQSIATGIGALAVAVGDFNGDGRPDLAVTGGATAGSVSVLLNITAPGAITPSFAAPQIFAVGAGPVAVAVGDFNGDGRLDLAVANGDPISPSLSVLLNTTVSGASMPSFAPQQAFFGQFRPYSVAVGDLNGDGRPDLVVANIEQGGVRGATVLLNTTAPGAATPSFAAAQNFTVSHGSISVAVGDLKPGCGSACLCHSLCC